jgi:hypothetical protein
MMYEFNAFTYERILKVAIFPHTPLIKSIHILLVCCPAYTSMALDFNRYSFVPLSSLYKEQGYCSIILLAFKCVIII